MAIKVFLLTIYIDNSIYSLYCRNMLKHIESGISGRGLGYDSFRYIKELASRFKIKGVVFTKPDGGIKVIADGEERDLVEFARKLERSSFFSSTENFYVKWKEPNEKIQETFTY